MKNYEYKAELRDPILARAICKQIGASRVVTLRQTDTYFNVARGRLKKRESVAVDRAVGSPEPVEYIFYERPDTVEPKVSQYHLFTAEQVRERFGQAPLPIWVIVEKTRELHLYRSVRIHLDQVVGLGWHFEFEILVDAKSDPEDVEQTATELRATFLPALGEPVAVSYADLLAQRETD